jgi:UDP-N-acetylglucosamine 2-epimerase (non-hydrolysing)
LKILSVVGARPNFVKIAPLLAEMRAQAQIRPVLVHTGQHYDVEMSGCFFQELRIPRPDFNLGVREASAAAQAAEIMKRLEPIIIQERPDVVVVVGDVNSTAAAALTAVQLGVPVAHVESGLRSFDRTMPEEINRVVTDAVSDLLLVSEPSGVRNLLKEGHPSDRIFLVGNVMVDTLRRFLGAAQRSAILDRLGLRNGNGSAGASRYAVLTLHRPALVDQPEVFRKIWVPVEQIAQEMPIIFPVHPRTQKRLRGAGFESSPAGQTVRSSSGVRMIAPLGYLQFLHLQSEATLVITDSGGIQEETTALGVPCLTVRDNTERPITVTEGTNTLVGLNPHRLREEVRKILSGKGKKGRVPILWDGRCAARIVTVLSERYGHRRERCRKEAGSVLRSHRVAPRQVGAAFPRAHVKRRRVTK